MKPKTRVMAVTTMLAVTVGFGALFFYIEEKKYEALYYQKELNELKQTQQQDAGFNSIIKQIATEHPNSTLGQLYQSKNIRKLSDSALAEIVSTSSFEKLGHDENIAIQSLQQH